MITENLLSVQSISLFLTLPGVLTLFHLVARIVSMLREETTPMITYTACKSLPSYMQSPNTLDILKNGELWGRVFPYRGGYALTAKPNTQGQWTVKRHIMLDVAGTKELISKLAAQ